QVDADDKAGGPTVDGEVLEVDGQAPAARTTATTGDGAGKPGDKPQELPSLTESISESMNQSMKIMMYLFPFFPIVGAYSRTFHIAIGLYFVTNNIWSAVQTHFFIERHEKELPMTSKEGLPPSVFR